MNRKAQLLPAKKQAIILDNRFFMAVVYIRAIPGLLETRYDKRKQGFGLRSTWVRQGPDFQPGDIKGGFIAGNNCFVGEFAPATVATGCQAACFRGVTQSLLYFATMSPEGDVVV
jgi:hypothetical protein